MWHQIKITCNIVIQHLTLDTKYLGNGLADILILETIWCQHLQRTIVQSETFQPSYKLTQLTYSLFYTNFFLREQNMCRTDTSHPPHPATGMHYQGKWECRKPGEGLTINEGKPKIMVLSKSNYPNKDNWQFNGANCRASYSVLLFRSLLPS